jgi:hypothetical protein
MSYSTLRHITATCDAAQALRLIQEELAIADLDATVARRNSRIPRLVWLAILA